MLVRTLSIPAIKCQYETNPACSYSFGVIQAGNGETTPVQCSAMAGSDGTLPAIAKGTCKESARTWTVDKTADGLKLTVSQMVTPSSSQSGSHSIPKSQLKIEQSGASSAQSYTGPAAFDLE